MMKPLSTQLADLSARAKKAEDAVAAAQKEAHDKLLARREQACRCHRRDPKDRPGHQRCQRYSRRKLEYA